MDDVDRQDMGEAAHVPDIVFMSKALVNICEALGLDRSRAAACPPTVVGGVMPDITLARIEALAAEAGARVTVEFEMPDGRRIDLMSAMRLV